MGLEKAIDLDPETYLELAVNDRVWDRFSHQAGFISLITNKRKRYLQ
jgi:hypothetical protein